LARVVTQALLDALRTTFSDAFKRGLGSAPVVGAGLSTKVPSSTAVNTYGFLGDLPIFRKWVGEKRIKEVLEKVYQLINDPYEATLGIHKHQVADDQLGLYPSIFEGWGMEAGAWMDRLRFEAMAAGHQRECFDGQNFFDTDHPKFDDTDGTWSNNDTTDAAEPWYLVDLSKPIKPLIDQERETPHFWWDNDLKSSKVAETGIMTAYGEARGAVGYTLPFLAYRSTKVLNPANFILARDAMKAFTDDNGEPRGIRPTALIAGISNQQPAKDTFKANLAGGESNTLAGAVTIIEADRLP